MNIGLIRVGLIVPTGADAAFETLEKAKDSQCLLFSMASLVSSYGVDGLDCLGSVALESLVPAVD